VKETSDLTEEQARDFLAQLEHDREQERQALLARGLPTHDMALDMELTPWLVAKVRASQNYAQNLYAAMCNQAWQEQAVWPILKDETWSCTWRTAGGIVARLRGEGDYMSWYCSGIGAQDGWVGEGHITDQIREDLARLGWRPADTEP